MPKLKAGIALFRGLRRVSWDTRHPPEGVCRRFERGDAQTSYKERPYFQVLAGGEPVGKPPFRGAIPSAYQIPTPIDLTAAPTATVARIRHIPHVFAHRAVSPVGKERVRGCKLNPRVEAEPHVYGCQFSYRRPRWRHVLLLVRYKRTTSRPITTAVMSCFI
jgi:hypothetical protein